MSKRSTREITPDSHLRTYKFTGFKADLPSDNPAFVTPADHPAVRAGESILGDVIGLNQPSGFWRFATDGGHFAKAGMTVIGFGPGEETLAHTVQESMGISELETTMAGNRALALELASAVERDRT